MRLVEAKEEALARKKLSAAAHLHDAALVDHQDPVCVQDCGQAVGHDDSCPSGPGFIDGNAHFLLCEGIQCGGGFVEQEEPGALQQGAGDGKALAFPAGERQSSFANDRFVRVGQSGYEFIDLCCAGSLPAPAGIIAPRIEDVFSYRCVPEKCILGDEANPTSQRFQGKFTQVDPIDHDRSGPGREETHDEVDGGGLAAAAGADDTDELTRLDAEGEFLCAEVAAAVVERYVLESERGPNRLRGRFDIFFLYRRPGGKECVPGRFRGESEEVVHSFGVDPRFLQVDMGAQQRLQHGVGAGQVGDEGHETANGQSALDDLKGAVTEDEAGGYLVAGFRQHNANQFVESGHSCLDVAMGCEPLAPASLFVGLGIGGPDGAQSGANLVQITLAGFQQIRLVAVEGLARPRVLRVRK